MYSEQHLSNGIAYIRSSISRNTTPNTRCRGYWTYLWRFWAWFSVVFRMRHLKWPLLLPVNGWHELQKTSIWHLHSSQRNMPVIFQERSSMFQIWWNHLDLGYHQHWDFATTAWPIDLAVRIIGQISMVVKSAISGSPRLAGYSQIKAGKSRFTTSVQPVT